MYQPTNQVNSKNTELLRNLLETVIEKSQQYDNFVYAYSQSRKFLILTEWSSYLLAYDNSFDNFLISQLKDINSNGQWTISGQKKFTRADIDSFRKSVLGQHTLKLKDGASYTFFLAPYIPTTMDAKYALPIKQEEKIHSILGKIKSL